MAEAADPDANIIFGAVIDESLQDEVRITVIATGFDQRASERKQIIEELTQRTFNNDDIDIPAFLRRKR